MNAAQMREELKKMYPSPGWAKKVATMSDAQVTAIYLQKKREGKV